MHYHGYVYRPAGHGKPPADYDERYRAPWGKFWDTSPWVPTMVAWWLLKPRSFVRNTSDTPDEAIAWAASLWRPLFEPLGDDHPDHRPMTMRERLDRSRASLTLGVDAVLCGPVGQTYLEVWVLACPNRVTPPPPCPLRRTDGRPPELPQLTGVPLYRSR